MTIDRAFVRIAEGLVHYRHCAPERAGRARPLYMIHSSPMSALPLEPLMAALGGGRAVIAPDTLGNGDSAGPEPDAPDMDYYADSVARVLDALGLDCIDLYGSHTGAHIACELALRHPSRVNRIVFDGVGVFSTEDKNDFLRYYAPAQRPDEIGSQFLWAWNWTRDGFVFFPNFRRTEQSRRAVAIPSATALHTMTVELLKSLSTYHKAYHAAFRHPDRERLTQLRHPVFCMASEDDILAHTVTAAAQLIPGCRSGLLPSESTPAGLAAKAAAVADFLDG
jgi:pimeloyl-ACP methyl ester carboxylesterase